MERYIRQIMLSEIGEAGQQRLAETSVLVVGLGGLGSPVCQYLVCAGIGRIGLCDKDIISASNLNRQTLYGDGLIGKLKTEAARERLSQMSGSTRFDLWQEGLTESNARNIISAYDIIVDCCDNHATRYLLDEVCHELKKTWIYGSIGEFEGRVSTFVPGGLRYSDLFPDRESLSAVPPSAGGVIGMVPGLIGTIEASEVIKHVCRFGETLVGKIMTIDLKNLKFNIFEL